jgi:hypothetical protein
MDCMAHRRDTWTSNGICWPEALLPKEEALSQVHILTFGYDANVVDNAGCASLDTLFEHSMNLTGDLSRERRQDAVSEYNIDRVEIISKAPQRATNTCGNIYPIKEILYNIILDTFRELIRSKEIL